MEQHQAYGHSGPAYAFQQEESTYSYQNPGANSQPSNLIANGDSNHRMNAYQQQQHFGFLSLQQQQQQQHMQQSHPQIYHPQPLPPIHFASQPQAVYLNSPPSILHLGQTTNQNPMHRQYPHYNNQQPMTNYIHQPRHLQPNPNPQQQQQQQQQQPPPKKSIPSLPSSVTHSPQPSAGATVRLQSFVFPPDSASDSQQPGGSLSTASTHGGMSNVASQKAGQNASDGAGVGGAMNRSGISGKGFGSGKQRYSDNKGGAGGSEAPSISTTATTHSSPPIYPYPVSKNGTPLLSTQSHYQHNQGGRNGSYGLNRSQKQQPQQSNMVTNLGEQRNATGAASTASPSHPILARLPALPELPPPVSPPEGLNLEQLQSSVSTSVTSTSSTSPFNQDQKAHPEAGPDHLSSKTEDQSSCTQEDLLDFIKRLTVKVKILEERDSVRNLREEALAFRPELAYHGVPSNPELFRSGKEIARQQQSDIKGKGKDKDAERKPDSGAGFQPVLGVRLLQRIDLLQRENEELGSILSEELGLDLDSERKKFKETQVDGDSDGEEEKETLKKELRDAHALLTSLSSSLTAATNRAKAAESALAIACAQISSQPVSEIGNGGKSGGKPQKSAVNVEVSSASTGIGNGKINTSTAKTTTKVNGNGDGSSNATANSNGIANLSKSGGNPWGNNKNEGSKKK